MAYFFAILGAAAAFFASFAIAKAFSPGGSDIHLILGAVCGVIAAVLWVGAGILFRMDEHYSKKEPSK